MLIPYKEFIESNGLTSTESSDEWYVLEDDRVSSVPDCLLYLQPDLILSEANYRYTLSVLESKPVLDHQYLVIDSKDRHKVLDLLATLDDYPLLSDEVYALLLEEYGYTDDPEFGVIPA